MERKVVTRSGCLRGLTHACGCRLCLSFNKVVNFQDNVLCYLAM
ncbi:hypothetical protein HanPSC8_Chr08g0337131 [Helianthus annuus]|nr:hypothetical protein HanPSC8_Chr08g0337131 [Helianthus annuus]